ncbi:group II intron reverse transcriptase/maturase [Micromonospora sp. B11E3]|uniref:group II intron reverse transcriptase/maturase n=1 Tax=Micromonospora sp. B11E3 TaxID=3153562 RepID=UPI00325D65C9
MSESKSQVKPFAISKRVVWEAYERVKANKGAAGVDGQTIVQYEQDLQNNLYRLWNRLSSGSYFPPPVKAVEIPKAGGAGVRVLGVPTVDDRIAQTVAAMYLEPEVERVFHPDSYGYRPGRSALDAVGRCRERCWRNDWVVDLDIRVFFDSVDHSLMLKAVERHTDQTWILLYVRRWLKAPMQRQDGSLVARDRGTPQGSAISPVLANLYLHYAFDMWLVREFPTVTFERYCDDAVIHCGSEEQARQVRDALAQRLAQVGLELHPDKTRIVYCKDADRRGDHEVTSFTFLGYTFRPRLARNKWGKNFVNFLPAVSKDAIKAMGREIRSWHIARRSDKSLGDLARMFNSIVQGWINYYGRFYKSMLYPLLRRINEHLVRWAMRKYKRLRRRETRVRQLLAEASRRSPRLFAHWRIGLKPDGWTMGAR